MEKLQIQTEELPNGTIIRLSGDATNAIQEQLMQGLLPHLEKRTMMIILDLSELRFIASLALGDLINFRRDIQTYGGTMRLAGANASIEAVLETTKLVELFPLYPDVQSAMDA